LKASIAIVVVQAVRYIKHVICNILMFLHANIDL
jgi:hypothetical protein